MELKHIQAFLMIVEKESFSLAAEALYTTQPTISLRIQHLEQSLNAKLFKRISGKKVILTEAGEIILPYFKNAYDLIQEGAGALQAGQKVQKKVIISCPNYIGEAILPELLKTLYEAMPDIEFDVKVMITDDIIEKMRNGEIDIALAYLSSQHDYDDLDTVQVTKEKNILVCSPAHPLANCDPLSLADLKNERIIIYNRIFPTTKIVEQSLQKQGLHNYQYAEINHLGWIKLMLRRELGVAFLQKMIVIDELKSGQLIELPLAKPLPPTPIYLVFKSSFSDHLKEITIESTKALFANLEN
ncbi:hypothetical protein SD71_01455 [Cohnella kolymensis]|uniref:HTH lysR-type domain-containing protein n=1 Tax=Cohnella kolymensis TaxID=1590652 RepID=A0ABR5A8P7_9BACL|nr:LysR family transcriptional regulator [Cohnella kolymensis]KIL37369.1 hypothetical protein SD71_01455 [Cohnella kolymensis]